MLGKRGDKVPSLPIETAKQVDLVHTVKNMTSLNLILQLGLVSPRER